jgi:methylenetetrahydrofolate reductase (NADPH)
MIYKSNLEKVLSEKKFAVTAEIGPPKGADPNKIKIKAETMRKCADAFNITDNQTAVVRLSSFGGCVILLNMGLEPVMQITCRDRNRLGLQSDVLGAASVGIRNIFFITGDHQSFGNHPGAKGVYDIDSIQLIQIVKDMRDKGVFQSGDKILASNPNIYIGAAANPFADPFELRVDRLEKKVDSGVDFIQTQSIFNIDKFNCWMDEVRSRDLDKRVHILAGLTPLKSLRMTERMKFHVPGVDIPDIFYNKMKKTNEPMKVGFDLALDIIKEIKKIKGIHGLHISALFWEDVTPELVKNSGLYPRPYPL